jgi:hypothetical protein
MRYQSPEPISKERALEVFRSGTPQEISMALISAALYEDDRVWVEEWIIKLSRHQDVGVRGTSAVALGHVARLHGEISPSALAAIRTLLDDERTVGAATNAISDVRIFVGENPE